MTWVLLAIFAAITQNFRFMLQKHLADTGLSVAGATFSRYVWSAPAVCLIVAILLAVKELPFPNLNPIFAIYVCIGGVTQILATVCVVSLFKQRNFTVGITFKKTETLQAAIVGVIILGDFLPLVGWGIILLGVLGVILLSDPPKGNSKAKGLKRFINRAAGLGIASGILFGICGVCYRGAGLSLGMDDFVTRAIISLACAIVFQTLILGIYLRIKQPNEMSKVFSAWRITSLVGLTSMIGSGCLFMAFTLQNVAYVNAVGQIEVVFAAMGSYFWFNERASGREILGITLVMLSIVLLIIFA